jgi:excisionase family DNA binding protein
MAVDAAPTQPPDDPAAVLTTSAAARLLGVSSTTVQVMVERGELRAWKTRGGHRRISRASLEALRAARDAPPASEPAAATPTVLAIEADAALRRQYETRIGGWGLALRVVSAADALDGLLLIERLRPAVLLAEPQGGPVDAIAMLRRLRTHDAFDAMAIVVVTALDDAAIRERGGLPPGIAIYRKPAPFETLRGFIEASLLRRGG